MKEYYHLIRRVAWTVIFLAIVVIGQHLKLPSTIENPGQAAAYLQLFVNISAGNLQQLSLFSLGLGPYMIALILWSTITMLDLDVINNLSKQQSGYIQRMLTLIFAVFQSVTTVYHFESSIQYFGFDGYTKNQVDLILMTILTAGAMIVSFIADMNVKKGIGKQMILILPGLIANTPTLLVSGLATGHSFFTSRWGLIVLVIISIIFLYISIYFYQAEYRVPIQQTGMDVNFKNSYIPIKFMVAGAMPFMFAVTLFSIPQLLILVPALHNTTFLYVVLQLFSYQTIPGIIMYAFVVILLNYGFANVNVRVFKIAKSLREAGDYIYDVMPGIATEKYIKSKVNVMIFMSSIYMVIISVVPLAIGLKVQGISNLSFYFGSLFMIIVMIDNVHEDVKFLSAKRHYKLFRK